MVIGRSKTAILIVAASGLLCMVYGGCAKDGTAPASLLKQAPATRAQALQQMGAAQVQCSDLSNCPGSIGMVVSVAEASAVTCTGFLIDLDKLMTNKHCINGIVGDCSTSMKILFPMSGEFHAEAAQCAEILTTSVDGSGQDYAIIRLKAPLARKPVKISRDGIHQGFRLRNPRVEVLAGPGLQGEVRSAYCRVIQNSVLVPSFDNDLAPLGTVSDCDIHPSNTGSPLLDSKGRARGIVQTSLGKDFDPLFQKRMLEAPQAMHAIGNFACIATPMDSSNVVFSENCQVRPSLDLNENLRQALAKLDLRVEKDFADKLNDWPEKLDKFEWSVGPISQNEGEQIYIPKPKCYSSELRWLKAYRNLGGFDETGEIRGITLRAWKLQHGLNSYFQPLAKISDYSVVEATIQFSPKDLNAGKSSLTITLGTFDGNRYFAEMLPVCAL